MAGTSRTTSSSTRTDGILTKLQSEAGRSGHHLAVATADRRVAPVGPRPASLTPASGLGLGVAMLWFSLLVPDPDLRVVVTATGGGW